MSPGGGECGLSVEGVVVGRNAQRLSQFGAHTQPNFARRGPGFLEHLRIDDR